ncbi:hypothetical protein DL93DRAFT_2167087 [Clavulina sp. PMI_390]|nr:hypothetical protein DL93DRAFT_2167087 [Clavulina sp. PMI_390]
MIPARNPHLGHFFVGNLLSSILFGVITVQTQLYYRRFLKDPWWIKALVAFLWYEHTFQVRPALELISDLQRLAQLSVVVITSLAIYSQTIQYIPVYPRVPWNATYWIMHWLVSSTVIQIFFAYRLLALSGQRIFTYLIGVIIVVHTVRAFEFDIVSIVKGGIPKGSTPTVTAMASLSVIVDLSLAFGVTITLRKQRTGSSQTDRILNWIILYVAATGVATSILAILILIWIHMGDPYSALIISVPYGGVYIACGLAHLHARSSLRARFTIREQPAFRSRNPSLELQPRSRENQSGDDNGRPAAATKIDFSTISTFSTTLTTNNPSTRDGLEINGHPPAPEPIEIKRTVETITQSSCSNCVGIGPNHEHLAREAHSEVDLSLSSPSHLAPTFNETSQDSSETGTSCPGDSVGLASTYTSTSTFTHVPVAGFSPTEMLSEGHRPLGNESQAWLLPSPVQGQRQLSDEQLQDRAQRLDARESVRVKDK